MEIQRGIEGHNSGTTMSCIVNDSGDVILGFAGGSAEEKSIVFLRGQTMYDIWSLYSRKLAKLQNINEQNFNLEYSSDVDPCRVLSISHNPDHLTISMKEVTTDGEEIKGLGYMDSVEFCTFQGGGKDYRVTSILRDLVRNIIAQH